MLTLGAVLAALALIPSGAKLKSKAATAINAPQRDLSSIRFM